MVLEHNLQEKLTLELRQLREDYAKSDLTDAIAGDPRLSASGGYSDVYQAYVCEDRINLHRVAIKCPRLSAGKEKEFCNEIRLLSSLHHENILPCLGMAAIPSCDIVGVVSPWMDNGTLSSYLSSHFSVLDLRKKLNLVCGIASGFRYLHQLDIVHADVKSDNILIDAEGAPVLSDSGLSRHLNNRYYDADAGASGSARWMARELIEDFELPSKASDVWGFGMVAYEILSGKVPYHEICNDTLVRTEISSGSLPAFRFKKAATGVVAAFIHILEGTWRRDPCKRLTMNEIVSELNNLGESYTGSLEENRCPIWPMKLIHTNKRLSGIAISSSKRMIATGGFGGIELWNSISGKSKFGFLQTSAEDNNECCRICFSQDEHFVAMLSTDFRLTVWDTKSGLRKFTHTSTSEAAAKSLSPRGSGSSVPALAFSKDSRHILFTPGPAAIEIREVRKRFRKVHIHSNDISSIKTIASDGLMVISADLTKRNRLRIWSPLTGKTVATIVTDNDVTQWDSLHFTPDSRRIIHFHVADGHSWMQTWNVRQVRLGNLFGWTFRPEYGPHRLAEFPEYSPSFNRNGSTMILGTSEGVVSAWDIASMNCIWESRVHASGGVCPAIMPCGEYMVTIAEGGVDLRLWKISQQKRQR